MTPAVVEAQLEILFQSACILADRVAAGDMHLLDAADLIQSAAEFAGVVDNAGQDRVQEVLAWAFVGGAAA